MVGAGGYYNASARPVKFGINDLRAGPRTS